MNEHSMSLSDQEKRRAAWHEAGHMVVCAIKHGHMMRGTIWFESNNGDESLKEWRGQAHGSMFSAEVAVAGIVAESMLDEPAVESFEIMDYWVCNIIAPSDTDLRFIPDSDEARESAVSTALDILRENFELLQEVAALLEDVENGIGCVTDGMLKECVERRNR